MEQIVSSPSVPHTAAMKLLTTSSAEKNSILKDMNEAERQVLRCTHTPHGPVLQQFTVLKTDGQSLTVLYVKPAALLWIAVKQSPAFGEFLRQHLPSNTSAVCVYMDDVRPGNAHRPDNGRTYLAWYYSFLDLPEWWRTSELGWFDLAFTMWEDCKDIQGGVSALTDALLAAVDFPIQVQLPLEEVPQPLWEFYFAMVMADAKAIQQMLGIKPSSGYKPCATMANLVGRVSVENVAGPYLQHYSCGGTALWDPWTSERWHDAARLVADEWEVSAERGERMETMLGIYHNGGRGLPYSARAPLYRLPETVQWDAMHCIWASGGIGQYQVNQFVREVTHRGLPLAQVEARVNTLTYIPTINKLTNNT